jgi:uncharacterized membrane protein
MFGQSGKGPHAWHLGKVAVVDFAMTLVAAFAIGQYTAVPADVALVVLLLLAWALHTLFCVATPTQAFLGLGA